MAENDLSIVYGHLTNQVMKAKNARNRRDEETNYNLLAKAIK